MKEISREEATIELTKAVVPFFVEKLNGVPHYNEDALAECVLNLLAVAGYVPVQTDFIARIRQHSGDVIKNAYTS